MCNAFMKYMNKCKVFLPTYGLWSMFRSNLGLIVKSSDWSHCGKRLFKSYDLSSFPMVLGKPWSSMSNENNRD